MKKKKVKLSLTIVTYNNSKIITDTINSIVNNIPENYEYILYLVDNNSTDDTVELVKNLNGNIEIVDLKENNGFGYGHNKILDYLQSDYHLVVNPDVIIEDTEQMIKMVNYMEENTDVGMLSPLIVNPDTSIQYLNKKNPTVFDMLIRRISPNIFKKRQDKYILKNSGYDKIMQIPYASGCFMFFRTSIFKKLKGFDDNFFMYLEDADITRRVNQVSKAIFYPKARIIHAWERGSHKSMKLALITIKSMIVYFNKWGWKII